MKTFGQIIAAKRKELRVSQKDLAAKIKKDDGTYISAQYLNDIEHDRRNPPSEEMIKQIAGELEIDEDYLFLIAGTFPRDMQDLGRDNPEKAKELFRAFRRILKWYEVGRRPDW